MKVSQPFQSLDCRGCTATVSFATEALKHVAKCLPAVPCFHILTLLSVQFLGPKWPRTEITNDRTGCTDLSQDQTNQGLKWPHTGKEGGTIGTLDVLKTCNTCAEMAIYSAVYQFCSLCRKEEKGGKRKRKKGRGNGKVEESRQGKKQGERGWNMLG